MSETPVDVLPESERLSICLFAMWAMPDTSPCHACGRDFRDLKDTGEGRGSASQCDHNPLDELRHWSQFRNPQEQIDLWNRIETERRRG